MNTANQILPADIVFHPSWWYTHAGITFDEDFFYHPKKRVESERRMEAVLYDRFGDSIAMVQLLSSPDQPGPRRCHRLQPDALAPKQAFEPTEIFSELKKRQILVHEEINPLPQTSRPICQCMKKTG